MINLRINGQVHSVETTEDTPLLWVLRDPRGHQASRGSSLGYERGIQ